MPAGIKSYRDLIAGQKAMSFAEAIYAITARFPAHEQFGLTNQLRRAVISIPSNIAEGHARNGGSDFIRFLRIPLGSLNESMTQLELARRLQYVGADEFSTADEQSREVERILFGLIHSLETRNGK